MKKLLSIALFLSLFLASCKQSETPEEIFEKKMAPNEYREFVRFGIEQNENIKAYEQAVSQFEQSQQSLSPTPFDDEWTLQGPGNIGARANTLATDPNNAKIIYAGFASGGVWKTTDGGETWLPIFDDQVNTAIGKITLDPSDPNTVYVGTGDPNIPGVAQIGAGLFKSMNGGDTWEYIGLKETYIINDILVHPDDSDLLLVATMGLPSVKNGDRGIYRSINGGESWTKVLHTAEDAGFADLDYFLDNPNRILAAGWNRYRTGTESYVIGEEGDIYHSDDFGETWTESNIQKPDTTCRTGVCFSETNPDIAFALIISEDYGLEAVYKSTDGGINFSLMETATEKAYSIFGGFGWYFGKIRSYYHPVLERELIYLLGVGMIAFDETTENWDNVTPPWYVYDVHADKHDLIKDANGDLLLATDGGLYKHDYTTEWEWDDIENIPTTQFYRTAYNPHEPWMYWGGAQDNGTSRGNKNGVNDWSRIWGGDGFQAVFHPVIPNLHFYTSQNGNIVAYNTFTEDYSQVINEVEDRRNWDTPYFISQHEPYYVYVGTHRLLRVEMDEFFDKNIDTLSEDLTDGIIYKPSYHNVSTIAESPIKPGLIYAGTSDGNVWRMEDGIWTDVTVGLPDRYITSVEPSPNNVNRVIATVSGYKWNEYTPFIFLSEDKGETWEPIQGNLPEAVIYDAFIYPQFNDSLICAATDFGVYATGDQGQSWSRVGTNMPIIPVNDLKHHIANNELIAGTFARGIQTYPLDSLLQAVDINTSSVAVEKSEISLYPNPATTQIRVSGSKVNTRYRIVSNTGVEIQNGTVSNESIISVQDFQSGQYYLILENQYSALPFIVL